MTIDRILKHHSGEAPLPEPETVGDWAGHTPKPEVETEDNNITLDLRQRPRLTITQQVFGLEPYIIIRPSITEDDGDFVVRIEAGGGVELDGVGEFLEVVAEAMQADVTQEGIAAAMLAAAQENDDEE